MKSLTISRSRDVIISLRLAGIEGVYCKNESELKTKFKQYKEDENVGIIILIEDDFKLIEEEVIEVKLSKKLPLVVTIPDRNGLKDKDFIMRYIKESVGVKVN
ncbi:V/A-type H+-transporting ATPase subunit F [Anaerosphaera aminiphila DSM 21120]|uniref:V/A-type H+-transporting ATPase subunit F n=1 Tax=Anaerosphaera aminiphila DSM 21120 TaxID=1120995 RepID=A0A1M5SRE5_9FIRM|nr:V-type ATP synthase subunit F [Anaerosphaera aminiphila]SHH41144.1 V/A-type H+-transporting ATPase subunit F [Anaerosphaera aminiphila DSM 21120]